MIIKITAFIIGLIAIVLTFKAELILEKVFKKEPTQGLVPVSYTHLRKTQTSCFNFMIPKLALEIIESPGHYHEVMINTETMPPSFWNWFLIGYNKSKEDEDKMLAYTRVYSASKAKMSRIPAKKKMRETFKDVVE